MTRLQHVVRKRSGGITTITMTERFSELIPHYSEIHKNINVILLCHYNPTI